MHTPSKHPITKKIFMSIFVLALTLSGVLLPQGASGADRFWLVRDGQPAAMLVVPEDPLQVVQSAAEELQHHLKLISGAELPIVTNRAGLSGNLVRFGAAAARAAGLDYGPDPNSWIGSLKDKCLFLAGDDGLGPVMMTSIIHNHVRRGTLFSVYDFLETQLGVRWLWPGDLGTVVSLSQNISLDAYDRAGKPALYFSRFRDGVGERGIANTGGWSSPLAARRFHQEKVKWLLRHRFAMPLSMNARHAYTDWWKQYGETHPEYFNLLPDGTRRSDPFYCEGKGQYVSMCVSNPDLHRKIVAEWLRTRRPFEPFVSAGENDTCGKCTCPRCMAWDVPDPTLPFPWEERLDRARKAFEAGEANWYECLGSLSDRYARFYQALLEEARQHDPRVKVMALAYANYVKRPLKVKVSPDVVFFVTVPQYYPFTEEQRQANRGDWMAWSKAGASLILRPNYMLEGAAMPLNLAQKRGEDFKFFADNNMIGNDFDSLMGQFGTMGLTLYVTARLNDQPSLSLAAVFEEYYAAFGSAADAVRTYFDYLASVADHPPEPKLEGGGWFTYGVVGYRQFTPEVMTRARDLIKQAEQAAKTDTLAGQRVAFLEKGLQHAELTAAMQQAFAEHKAGAGDAAAVRSAITRLVRFRYETEDEFIGDYGRLYDWETRYWNIPRLLKGIPEQEWHPALTNRAAAVLSQPPLSECGQRFVIRLAEETAVERVAFRNREALLGCKDFKLAFSQDGVTFREALSGCLQPAEPTAPTQVFSLKPPQPARLIRLEILSGYSDHLWSLRDVEFWTPSTDGTPARNVAPDAELTGWTSDYGCHAYFANAARLMLDDDPETFWVSAPLPLACLPAR